jgi:hypothetical protein
MIMKKHTQASTRKITEMERNVYSIKKLKEKSLKEILNQMAD